jgi:hypothetical protein
MLGSESALFAFYRDTSTLHMGGQSRVTKGSICSSYISRHIIDNSVFGFTFAVQILCQALPSGFGAPFRFQNCSFFCGERVYDCALAVKGLERRELS